MADPGILITVMRYDDCRHLGLLTFVTSQSIQVKIGFESAPSALELSKVKSLSDDSQYFPGYRNLALD